MERRPSDNRGCLPLVGQLLDAVSKDRETRKARKEERGGAKGTNKKKNNRNREVSSSEQSDSRPSKRRQRVVVIMVLGAIGVIGTTTLVRCSDSSPFEESENTNTAIYTPETPDHTISSPGQAEINIKEANRAFAERVLLSTGRLTEQNPDGLWSVGEVLSITIDNPQELGFDDMQIADELVVRLTGVMEVTVEQGDSPIGLVKRYNPDLPDTS